MRELNGEFLAFFRFLVIILHGAYAKAILPGGAVGGPAESPAIGPTKLFDLLQQQQKGSKNLD